jgi:hypothetical protein
VKLPKALDLVLMEISLKDLSIWQLDPSSPLFGVLGEHSFVELPVVLKKVKISVVESAVQNHRVIVVDLPETIELVLGPHSLIGHLSALIV